MSPQKKQRCWTWCDDERDCSHVLKSDYATPTPSHNDHHHDDYVDMGAIFKSIAAGDSLKVREDTFEHLDYTYEPREGRRRARRPQHWLGTREDEDEDNTGDNAGDNAGYNAGYNAGDDDVTAAAYTDAAAPAPAPAPAADAVAVGDGGGAGGGEGVTAANLVMPRKANRHAYI